MKNGWMIGFLLGMCGMLHAEVEPIHYYVSPAGKAENNGSREAPLATIIQARDQIRTDRAAGKTGPWVVTLAEGEYPIAEPILWTTEDSGTPDQPIVYRGAGDKTILSGGLEITPWREENGVWVADLPQWNGQTLFFEQLFVNGQRATRSRYPKEGFLHPAKIWEEFPMDRKTRRAEKPQTRQQITAHEGDLEILNTMPKEEWKWTQMVIHHHWDTTRRILLGWDAQTQTLEFQGGTMKSHNPWRTSSLYYLENVRAAFTQPGDWFYDGNAKKVFYRPRDGEKLSESRFIVPRPGLSQLAIFQGKSATEPVTDIRLENLTFHYSDTPRRKNVMENAQLPVEITGNLDQSGPSQFEPNQAAAFTLAVVMVDDAQRIVFQNCELAHLGEYGLWFKNASECQFVDGKLTDLGAGGVRLGGGRAHESSAVTSCEKNVVHNCQITRGGRFHASAVGVWIGNQTVGNRLTHNEIADFYYTGVSVGWNWGYAGVCFDNIIEYNHIHHIGQGALADMGGVYTLGTLTGTRVCHNVIHDVESYGYGGWGLYTDEGSEGILMEKNLVYDTMDGSFHQHYGKDNIIRNNIFARNKANPLKEGEPHQLAITRVENHRSVVFERNIIYWDEGTSIGYNFDKVDAVIRNNLWWKTTGKVEFRGKTHEEWVEMGKDVGGIVADPLFYDAKNNDFRLKENSPAHKIGFQPFLAQ